MSAFTSELIDGTPVTLKSAQGNLRPSCIPDVMRFPDFVSVSDEGGWLALARYGESFDGPGVSVAVTQTGAGIDVAVESAHGMRLNGVQLRWNGSFPATALLLGDHWERGYGDLGWLSGDPGRVLPWYFLVNDGNVTHGYGVKTGAASICHWRADSTGLTLYLDIQSGGAGVDLQGRRLNAATVVQRRGEAGESAFDAACAFCRSMCDKPLAPPHPVYGANNWYYAYGNSSHEAILSDARIVAGLSPETPNRPYMIIDDGWQASSIGNGGASGGPWDAGNARFPDMPGLAAEIKRSGARPGIWIRPLSVAYPVAESRLLPASRYIGSPDGDILDPSIDENLAVVEADMRRFREWGYELIKHDFTTFDIFGRWGLDMSSALTNPGWLFSDRTRTTSEIVTGLYLAIRRGAGSSLVIGCNTIGHLAAGLVEIQRTGDDTSGREWERTRKMGINTLAFRMPQHGTFFAADADCVGITSSIPWELNRQWLDVLALSGTPLFVSVDPKVIGPEQADALRAAYAAASQPALAAEPLDWMETLSPTRWKTAECIAEFDWTDHAATMVA